MTEIGQQPKGVEEIQRRSSDTRISTEKQMEPRVPSGLQIVPEKPLRI